MGYTHYWSTFKTVDSNKLPALRSALQKLLDKANVPLGNAHGDLDTKPNLSDEEIVFNGVEDNAHETFAFEFNDTVKFDFCKTRQKPYDKVVTAALTILKEFMGDDLSVRSDGEVEDWDSGVELASEVLGKPVKCPLDKQQEE